MFAPIESLQDCEFCCKNTSPWKFLDRSIVITLQDRPDRKSFAVEELHRTGLCVLTTCFSATRSPDGFRMGCWDSHWQVAKHCVHQKYTRVLILEDDFVFDAKRTADEIIIQIQDAVQKLPTNWTRLMLGDISYFQLFYRPGVTRSISVLTHAFIYSEKGLNWMVEHPPDPNTLSHIDMLMGWTIPFSYSVKPMVAFQRPLGSDRQEDFFLNQENIQATDYWIPVVWIVVLCLVCLILFFILWKGVGWGKVPSVIFIGGLLCLFFFILWATVLFGVW